MTPQELRAHAESIWRAGVAAVDSRRLVRDSIAVTPSGLRVCGDSFPLVPTARVAVVGAGKAGAGMAAGVEDALAGSAFLGLVDGWVNVPANCVRRLQRVHLHAARPPGLNEPTADGVEGTGRILAIASELRADDLCVVLLSGGGSALLPAPVPAITLEDKQHVTRLLMAGGATIDELNCVRKHLSRIKGGGLARATSHTRLVSLIISDVVGDPLDVIASGPTVPDTSTAAQALAVLRRYPSTDVPPAVLSHLEADAASPAGGPCSFSHVRNHIVGSNTVALEAAATAARALGYEVRSLGSANRGDAREEGRLLADMCSELRDAAGPGGARVCVLSGGEPTVQLARTDRPRKGGRNQELALAALLRCWARGMDGLVVLSGGTDGEDGPTDAAGAIADATALSAARSSGIHPGPYLEINDSYTFFKAVAGLLKTGPTDTNVMDVRVALVVPATHDHL